MKQFAYKQVFVPGRDIDVINNLGKKGWEVVSFTAYISVQNLKTYYTYLLKREVESAQLETHENLSFKDLFRQKIRRILEKSSFINN